LNIRFFPNGGILILEKCIQTGKYPSIWKKANVQPVHKKNSRQDKTNYRPISLLPILSKIFEKILFDSIYNHLNSNDLLSKHQSGFRPGDSTVNQLLAITHRIFESFEEGSETRDLFLISLHILLFLNPATSECGHA
jgi:hypothetical protein